MTVSLNSWQSVMLKPGIFPFLCRTHGLVSSAAALGVITDADGDESTRKAEPSPVQDRAARYRLARLGSGVKPNYLNPSILEVIKLLSDCIQLSK